MPPTSLMQPMPAAGAGGAHKASETLCADCAKTGIKSAPRSDFADIANTEISFIGLIY